jgi:hypothetical protein
MKVKIIAKDGWMGHPKGSIVDVDFLQKERMIQRGIAQPIKDKMIKRSKTKGGTTA